MGNVPSTRNVVRIALAVAGTAFALYLLYLIRGVLELIVLAVFVALWLGPFVEFLTRRRVPRVLAILAAYLTLFGSIVVPRSGRRSSDRQPDRARACASSPPASASCARTQRSASTTTSTRSP